MPKNNQSWVTLDEVPHPSQPVDDQNKLMQLNVYFCHMCGKKLIKAQTHNASKHSSEPCLKISTRHHASINVLTNLVD